MPTILVVDDEPVVLALIGAFLNSRGFRVLLSATAEEAAQVSGTYNYQIDLLIADHTLNRREEIARKLVQERPRMRVLQISGYLRRTLLKEGRLAPGEWFLEKPFLPNDLLRMVQSILGGGLPN